MAWLDIVVIDGSAGSIEAVTGLPHILSRSVPLPARHATDGEPIEPGRIYVAPPDRHLHLNDGHCRLTRGPKENGHRRAIDPTFRAAAHQYGPRSTEHHASHTGRVAYWGANR